jgi:methyl-accepting chemotaxis protein
MSLGRKLGIGFGMILALMVFTAVLGCYKISVAQGYEQKITTLLYPVQFRNATLSADMTRSLSMEREYILVADDAREGERTRRNWTAALDKTDSDMRTLIDLGSQLPEEKDILGEIRGQLADLRKLEESCIQIRQPERPETIQAAGNCLAPASSLVTKIREDSLGGIDHRLELQLKADMDSLAAANKAMYEALILCTVLAVSLGTFIAITLSRKIVRGVSQVLARAEAIANHDLSGAELPVLSEDEVGDLVRAVNKMQTSLTEIVQEVATNADHLASASEQISASATQQSNGMNLQKDQTQQMATAMHEMSLTVHEISENSNAAAQASSKASQTANGGGKVVEQTLQIMQGIAASVRETANKIEELGKGSDRIGKIVGVIDDIADQTNLLALNAAIEAARAGEQGRGFAVVADEVRKLAERTSTATKEISGMIGEIQKETAHAVEAMQSGTKHVELGVESTQRAGASLQEIIGSSDKVGEMITHIATAATEQASATQEVNRNVEQISAITSETAEGAGQSAQACQQLSNLALNLNSLMSRFTLGKTQRYTHPPTGSAPRPPERVIHSELEYPSATLAPRSSLVN